MKKFYTIAGMTFEVVQDTLWQKFMNWVYKGIDVC